MSNFFLGKPELLVLDHTSRLSTPTPALRPVNNRPFPLSRKKREKKKIVSAVSCINCRSEIGDRIAAGDNCRSRNCQPSIRALQPFSNRTRTNSLGVRPSANRVQTVISKWEPNATGDVHFHMAEVEAIRDITYIPNVDFLFPSYRSRQWKCDDRFQEPNDSGI